MALQTSSSPNGYATDDRYFYHEQEHGQETSNTYLGQVTKQNYSEKCKSSSPGELKPEDIATLEENLRWIPSQSLSSPPVHRLDRPIAIPRQATAGFNSPPFPFIRAYAPVLEYYQIDKATFIAFIDNLCVAQAPTPPLQVLNLAGAGIGFVPWHWAKATGAGIQAVAGVGSAGVSATRTKMFLSMANKEFFNPRGLNVRLCKDEELSTVIGYSSDKPVIA